MYILFMITPLWKVFETIDIWTPANVFISNQGRIGLGCIFWAILKIQILKYLSV